MKTNKFKWAIHLFFSVGICLLSFPVIKNTITLVKMQQTTVTITTERPSNIVNERINFPTIENYLNMSPEKLTAVGELMIPTQQIKLPIFAGLNNQQLLVGVGSMYPERDILKDNMVLLGHHLTMKDVLLGNLQQVKVNDPIFVTYLKESLQYQVIEKKIVNEADLSVLENTAEPKLTIITCDKPEMTDKRIVVIAELVKQESNVSRKYAKFGMQDLKTRKRNIAKYSVGPLMIVLLILIFGNYTLWRYV
ncbi:class A sortase [Enterococcus saccharolyticus]|uniref:class A sortase n=1 Tax=Enterococcus saccharolyticus TaxID=41997 RepID=UPI001E5824BD|nr:class A sortase [Enterococcus saccharolyticus]MCD5003498.1 class A sortase [Enterococcus saccharolyticus]